MWSGWLTALLQLNDSGRYSSSLPNTGERLLLTKSGEEAQTDYDDFVARGGQSPEPFSVSTGDVSTYLFVTPGSRIYID